MKPTMLYVEPKCWAKRKKKEHILKKNEMWMFRLIQGISLKDNWYGEDIRKGVIELLNEDSVRRRLWTYKAT